MRFWTFLRKSPNKIRFSWKLLIDSWETRLTLSYLYAMDEVISDDIHAFLFGICLKYDVWLGLNKKKITSEVEVKNECWTSGNFFLIYQIKWTLTNFMILLLFFIMIFQDFFKTFCCFADFKFFEICLNFVVDVCPFLCSPVGRCLLWWLFETQNNWF